jgi:ribosome-associated protein
VEKRAYYGLERLRKTATSLTLADLNAQLKSKIEAAVIPGRKRKPAAKKTVAKKTAKKAVTAKKTAKSAPAKKASAKKASAKKAAKYAPAKKAVKKTTKRSLKKAPK